jgi:hypothetical protein
VRRTTRAGSDSRGIEPDSRHHVQVQVRPSTNVAIYKLCKFYLVVRALTFIDSPKLAKNNSRTSVHLLHPAVSSFHELCKRNVMPQSSKSKLPGPLALLIEDHRKVQKLFKQFEKMDGTEPEAHQLVKQACLELTAHARLEEEVFYPALREHLDEQEILDEAEVEHSVAKQLIHQLDNMDPDEPLYCATFTVLGEYINHHVEEEESEMFKKVKRAKIDFDALAQEMEQRKQQIMGELGLGDKESGEPDEEATSDKRRKSGQRHRPRAHA